MKSKFSKKLLIPIIVIVVCAVVIAVVLVLALKGKDDGGGGHIVVDQGGEQLAKGELQITLLRRRLETKTLDSNGMPVISTDEDTADFSKTDNNIFGMDKDILIGPKCYFSAEMEIYNEKPYAFEYWLEIISENGDSLLADQLELTVYIGGEELVRRTLQDGLTTDSLSKVGSGEKGEFTVKLEYIDLHDNDTTKNTTLAFDLIVHAKLTES